MSSRKPDAIQDSEIQALMVEAERFMAADDNTAAVRATADAYLALLKRFPAVESAVRQVVAEPTVSEGIRLGTIRTAPNMWPRFGAKLHQTEGGWEISIDRKRLSFSEAVQYMEFFYDLALRAEAGEVAFDPANPRGPVHPAIRVNPP